MNNQIATFEQTYTTAKQIETILNDTKKLGYVNFCGNIGDPMTNPEIVDIVKFLKNKYPNIIIHIHTNGGIGNPNRYYELGQLGIKMIFGVDGTEGINELYRVNVNFQSVNRNAKLFVKGLKEFKNGLTTKSDFSLQLQFILWEQNIHNIPKYIEWAKEIEADSIFIRRTSSKSGKVPVYNNQGVYLHSLSYYDDRLTQFKYVPILNKIFTKKQFEKLLELWNAIPNVDVPIALVYEKSEKTLVEKNNFDLSLLQDINQDALKNYKNRSVDCHACLDNNGTKSVYVFITYKNIVLPCCYIGSLYSRSIMGEIEVNDTESEALKKLHDLSIENFDANIKSLDKILQDVRFHKIAYEDLNSNSKLAYCGKNCFGKRVSKYLT